ncbi:MAG: HAD-IB family phosphatase [Candidatus Promineifilaceae bacterium]|nr:HAD-IB family phosphatase [Candidatus Promineifilaceae bacterium]
MRWPPYQHIFFDCDSTLTAVEGIDALADFAGKGWRVEVLTRAAMEGNLDLSQVYEKRLQAVKPTRGQIARVRQIYKQHVVADAAAVIAALQYLNHKVYIISGGLAEPVEEFGVYLGVPRSHIRAVGVQYDELSGAWWRSDGKTQVDRQRYLEYQAGALTISNGKAEIVRELLGEQRGRALLIGDGVSDMLAASAVDLFVGFGGVVQRERVLAEAPSFLHSSSLAPLLMLATGPAMTHALLRSPHAATARSALDKVKEGAVTFQDERLRAKFQQACEAVYSRPY